MWEQEDGNIQLVHSDFSATLRFPESLDSSDAIDKCLRTQM